MVLFRGNFKWFPPLGPTYLLALTGYGVLVSGACVTKCRNFISSGVRFLWSAFRLFFLRPWGVSALCFLSLGLGACWCPDKVYHSQGDESPRRFFGSCSRYFSEAVLIKTSKNEFVEARWFSEEDFHSQGDESPRPFFGSCCRYFSEATSIKTSKDGCLPLASVAHPLENRVDCEFEERVPTSVVRHQHDVVYRCICYQPLVYVISRSIVFYVVVYRPLIYRLWQDGKRILFRFDSAAFAFKFLPFKVPYPVPFKLLGDEAKGWLDTTYLSDSGNIRISRGNKGTTFVLQKEIEPRQELLSAISTGYGVTQAIDKLISATRNEDEEPRLLEGEWKMIWSSQMETDSWLENAANGLMGSQIVKRDGQLRFLVDIVLGLRFSMSGTYQKVEPKKYEVKMDDAAIVAGSFGLPIEMLSKFNMELKYADDKLRITTGYNNIVFAHLRIQSP
ncbi:uncharacterized protein LOC141631183 [Silene latifolia]|uniref:uncharacterized protein LOC141631183 n=1 Tax=Silene latifolia TaxID=37657 RepID=UPI003D786C33